MATLIFTSFSLLENVGQLLSKPFFWHNLDVIIFGISTHLKKKWKTVLVIHLHFNLCYLFIHPDEDDKFISTYRKYELDPRSERYCRKAGCHRICWKSLGYWLTLSFWPCMTSRLQSSETKIKRLASILCILAKGLNTRCGGLCL